MSLFIAIQQWFSARIYLFISSRRSAENSKQRRAFVFRRERRSLMNIGAAQGVNRRFAVAYASLALQPCCLVVLTTGRSNRIWRRCSTSGMGND
jgi:hypothetical protein